MRRAAARTASRAATPSSRRFETADALPCWSSSRNEAGPGAATTDRIGQYEIVRRLVGRHGGSIYLGQRRGPAGFVRDVVIKVIHPHLVEQEQFVKMFMDEARIAARINHPNVVQVEELGEERGTFYLVMERVNGCSLHQIVRHAFEEPHAHPGGLRGPRVMKAALGLHAAHDATDDDGVPLRIVHRDVSPSNILVSHDGNVKVIDFGIAKANGRAAATHASHGLKGKLRYMSPEQAWGSEIDRRSDIYSLGVVLWEVLAVRALFKATNELALLEKVRAPVVPPISTVNPDVPSALDAVIAQATAPDPAARPSTAGELRALLAQAVPEALTVEPEHIGALAAHSGDDAPALALVESGELDDRPTTPDRSVRSPSIVTTRGRRRPALVGVAVVGAIAIGLAVWWLGQRADEPDRAPVVSQQPSSPAPQQDAAGPAPRTQDSIDATGTVDTRTVDTRTVDTGPTEPPAEVIAPPEQPAERARSGAPRERPRRSGVRSRRGATRKEAANAPSAPGPRHFGQTPIADEFEASAPHEEPAPKTDTTPIAEEFEQ